MRTLTAFTLLLALGCGGSSSSTSSSEDTASSSTSGGESGARSSNTEGYADDARALFDEAMEEFEDDDCLSAQPLFRRVRREYPYSRFAALSQLRVGDCQMSQREYAEAVQSFSSFVRYNASHAEVPYARFRIAEAHFKQIPTDWLLVPPAHERDLSSALDALRYLRRFILDHSSDEHVPEAVDMARRALTLLAGHELYAARYYFRRGAPEAAVMRLEGLVERYEGSAHDAEAWLLLGHAYVELDAPRRARVAFENVVSRWPESEHAEDARSALRRLPAEPPMPAAERSAPAAEEEEEEEEAAEEEETYDEEAEEAYDEE